jgi:hypothetical protein
MRLYYLYTDSLKCSLPGNTDGIAYALAPFGGRAGVRGGGIMKEGISPERALLLVFVPVAALPPGTKEETAYQTGDFRYR